MQILVMSDSHDHLSRMEEAVAIAKERGIENGIHLGDFCAPPALELLATCGLKWKCIWGNVDGDRLLSYQRVEKYGTMDLVPTEFRELVVEGRKLFLTHYPDVAKVAAKSGTFDAVFFGHNHTASQETVANSSGEVTETLLANPGETAGFRFGEPSVGIYDTETNTFEHVALTPA